jgi:FkbM family methyltransferase
MKIESLGIVGEGGWKMVTDGIDSKSIVYSFGVGDNIQWDLEMIKRFGCTVYAFDPDPMSAAWLAKQNVPKEFVFTPEGLSTFDGTQKFYDAHKVGKIDKSVIKKNKTFSYLPVKRLQTFMKERGHKHIDVLNVDIEGLEFAVLGDILNADVDQLMVELHPSFFRFGQIKTWFALWRIKRAGFNLLEVSGHDYLFAR